MLFSRDSAAFNPSVSKSCRLHCQHHVRIQVMLFALPTSRPYPSHAVCIANITSVSRSCRLHCQHHVRIEVMPFALPTSRPYPSHAVCIANITSVSKSCRLHCQHHVRIQVMPFALPTSRSNNTQTLLPLPPRRRPTVKSREWPSCVLGLSRDKLYLLVCLISYSTQRR